MYWSKVVDLLPSNQNNTMTRINNTTGSKAVIIRKNWSGFIAMYVQVYQGEEQVLDSKSYGTEKACIRWANKVLGIS